MARVLPTTEAHAVYLLRDGVDANCRTLSGFTDHYGNLTSIPRTCADRLVQRS